MLFWRVTTGRGWKQQQSTKVLKVDLAGVVHQYGRALRACHCVGHCVSLSLCKSTPLYLQLSAASSVTDSPVEVTEDAWIPRAKAWADTNHHLFTPLPPKADNVSRGMPAMGCGSFTSEEHQQRDKKMTELGRFFSTCWGLKCILTFDSVLSDIFSGKEERNHEYNITILYQIGLSQDYLMVPISVW